MLYRDPGILVLYGDPGNAEKGQVTAKLDLEDETGQYEATVLLSSLMLVKLVSNTLGVGGVNWTGKAESTEPEPKPGIRSISAVGRGGRVSLYKSVRFFHRLRGCCSSTLAHVGAHL